MGGLTLVGILGLIIFAAIGLAAIWLACVLLGEAQDIKKALKDVQCAFGNIEVEINRKLKVHNALHYTELIGIVNIVKKLVPGVNISIEKDFKSNIIHILVEAQGVRSKYTLLATIVEYGSPRLNETV